MRFETDWFDAANYKDYWLDIESDTCTLEIILVNTIEKHRPHRHYLRIGRFWFSILNHKTGWRRKVSIRDILNFKPKGEDILYDQICAYVRLYT